MQPFNEVRVYCGNLSGTSAQPGTQLPDRTEPCGQQPEAEAQDGFGFPVVVVVVLFRRTGRLEEPGSGTRPGGEQPGWVVVHITRSASEQSAFVRFSLSSSVGAVGCWGA